MKLSTLEMNGKRLKTGMSLILKEINNLTIADVYVIA